MWRVKIKRDSIQWNQRELILNFIPYANKLSKVNSELNLEKLDMSGWLVTDLIPFFWVFIVFKKNIRKMQNLEFKYKW